MPSQRLLILIVAPMAVVFGLLATVVPAWTADREKVLHSFNGKDGSYPHAGVIFDAAGNLYALHPRANLQFTRKLHLQLP
jgi:hypothetical protein